MTNIKLIKSKADYDEALKLIEELVDRDPAAGSADADRLTLLTALVRDYEAKAFPEHLPDPIEAIKFRMEQAGLKPVDLVPFIGPAGRVSEILSGKRQLTLEMVRALSSGLGIPAKVLIQKPTHGTQFQNWDTALVKVMAQRGYFGGKTLKTATKADLIDGFIGAFAGLQPAALYRKTAFRVAPRTDKNALLAWRLRVLQKAAEVSVATKYRKTATPALLQEVVRLSIEPQGPLHAVSYLAAKGIKLVIEPHLPKTHLDGATILTDKEHPIIGLTLRHDRPDNFWFTLIHELAHVALHYESGVEAFYDEELHASNVIEIDTAEQEADTLAEEAILPNSKWEISAAKYTPSPMAAESLARELVIHPSVIAGMIRFKHQNYYYLNKLVNDESLRVRKFFPDLFES
ncbi:MAG: plasmid stabilization protein [Acidobacteria bacterium]|nr:plasmid stabilization protein [Acidobacteriota bacterium]